MRAADLGRDGPVVLGGNPLDLERTPHQPPHPVRGILLTINQLRLLVKHDLPRHPVAVQSRADAKGQLDERDMVREVVCVNDDELREFRIKAVEEADNKSVALGSVRSTS